MGVRIMFNKIRLSYLDDLENNPEVMDIISNTDMGEWIKACQVGSRIWDQELYEAKGQKDLSSRSRYGALKFAIAASINYKDPTNVEIKTDKGALISPGTATEAYWHPGLDFLFASTPQEIKPFRNKLGLFLRNLEAYPSDGSIPVNDLARVN